MTYGRRSYTISIACACGAIININKESFRYDTSGRWYKGNTHIHTVASDGGKELAEIAGLYAAAGYDFLVATDHRVASDVKGQAKASRLLWLDGVEIDGDNGSGQQYHVVCIGKVSGITAETPFADSLQAARDCNAILVLAHPFWSGLSLEDAVRWDFDGVEIYNHVCRWLNGKGDGFVHWDAMLRHSARTLAFAADDAHLRPEHPGWNGGWIVVNLDTLSEESIVSAIRRGNYYSSCGPEFRAIELDGDTVHIATSAVQFVRLAGHGACGQRLGSFDRQHEISEASLTVPSGWEYAYIEIEDREGRRAWTNTLFA